MCRVLELIYRRLNSANIEVMIGRVNPEQLPVEREHTSSWIKTCELDSQYLEHPLKTLHLSLTLNTVSFR